MCGFQMVAAKFFPLQIRYFQSEFKLFSYWKKKKVAGDSPFISRKRFPDQVLPEGGRPALGWLGLSLLPSKDSRLSQCCLQPYEGTGSHPQ